MIDLPSTLSDLGGRLVSVFHSIRIRDFVDVAIVAFIVYHAIRLVRETRAMQLLKGIGAILLLYFVAAAFEMITLGFFIQLILQVGILAVVILFQPEIRSALEKMGRSNIGVLRIGGTGDEGHDPETEVLIEILVESCTYLSERKTGALIVIERKTRLGDVIKTGTVLDARPSAELINNIFFHNSPLHDGAMVIRERRLHAAGCYLPLSQNMEIGRELGTRHRAALGLSEVSDAVIVVVSEETGSITIASESRLQRGLSAKNLRKLLQIKLVGVDQKKPVVEKRGFWRFGK